MVTRTLTNIGDPVSGADDQPLSGAVITFQLVDEAKKQPVTLFDAAEGGGDLVVGNLITATTNEAGEFSVELWPNNRGEVATLYKVRLPGGISMGAGAASTPAKPFYIRVVEGEGDLTLLAAKTAMEALQPQTLSLFDALLANIIQVVSSATAAVTETTNGLMSFVDKVKLDMLSTFASDVRAYPSVQAAIDTGKNVLIPVDTGVLAPVLMHTGQALIFANNARLFAADGFVGDSVVVVDAGNTQAGVSAMENILITGNGCIDGRGIAPRGIFVKFARTVLINLMAIRGCPLHGVHVGDGQGAVDYSYEVTTQNVTIRNTGTGNTSDSTGIFYDKVTDSLVDNNIVVGYRTGIRNNSGTIVLRNNHPWTLQSYGPMKYGFYVQGGHTRLETNYADSPTSLGVKTNPLEGAVGDVYGYYLDAYNVVMSNNQGYLAVGTSFDNQTTGEAIGIYVAKSDGLFGTISGGDFNSGAAALKWKAVVGGNFTLNTQIMPAPISDGRCYVANTASRLNALYLNMPNNANMVITPDDGAAGKSAWLVVNSRSKFGYDGARGVVEISDNGGSKAIVVNSAGAERARVDSAGLTVAGGAYNNGHLILGSVHLWVEAATGKLRIKNGAPTSDSDGLIVGQQ